MAEVPKHIQGVDRVLQAFGDWPSFHDAAVKGIRLDVGTVTFTLAAFEMTSETDARGAFRLTKHHDVHFRFEDVVDVSLSEQNDTLFRLEISSQLCGDGRFLVVLDSTIGTAREGFGGSFRARSGTVLDVIATATQ